MLNPQDLSTQQSASTVISHEVSSLANNLFTIATDYRIARSVDFLGLLMMTLAVCLLCLQTYKSFKEQGLRPKMKEIILPILLIGLIVNNGKNLKELTFANINDMNNIKAPLNKVVNSSSRSPFLPVCAEQNYKSTGRSGIPTDNCNVSAEDAMTNAYIKELARKYYNYYSIE